MGFTPKITDINENEVLKYLGYRGQELPEEVSAQIEKCTDEVIAASTPRLVWKELPVNDGVIEGAELHGEDIAAVLSGCDRAVLMAVTLGAGVERLMMRRSVTDRADPVIMDVCASAVVENICGNFSDELARSAAEKGLYTTDRYSPGYGDMPLSDQRIFFAVLDITRRIGVSLTDTLLMVPRKSVTAVIGIADEPQEHRPRECESCPSFRTCVFRKSGVTCRGEKLK